MYTVKEIDPAIYRMPSPGSVLISFISVNMTKRGMNNKGKGIPMPAIKIIVIRFRPRNSARLKMYEAGAESTRIIITADDTTKILLRKYDPRWS
jgi:hypothetical protein